MNYKEFTTNNPYTTPKSRVYSDYLCSKFEHIVEFMKAKNKEEDSIKEFEFRNVPLLESIALNLDKLISEIENC